MIKAREKRWVISPKSSGTLPSRTALDVSPSNMGLVLAGCNVIGVTKLTSTLLLCALMLGCASTPDVKIGLPDRPILIPITQLQWEQLSPDMQDTIQHNDLSLKAWGKKLEGRIILHDESLK